MSKLSRSKLDPGTMKEPDPLGDFKKLLLRKRLEEIVAIPATLYFPAGIVAQLNLDSEVELQDRWISCGIFYWGIELRRSWRRPM